MLPCLATQPSGSRYTKIYEVNGTGVSHKRLSDLPPRSEVREKARFATFVRWRRKSAFASVTNQRLKLFVLFVTSSALVQQAGRRKLPSFNERTWTTPTCFTCHSYLTSSSPPSSRHSNFRFLSPRSFQFGSSAAQKRKAGVFVFPFIWMLLDTFQRSAVRKFVQA